MRSPVRFPALACAWTQVDWSVWLVYPNLMDIFNIHEAKAQFSKLMRRVEQGQEVLVARDGVVIARIVPESVRTRIKLGRDEGKGAIHPNFEAPLDDFEGYVQ
jgi:prevent-host-death family protein